MEIKQLYKLYQQHPCITTDSRDCPEGSIFLALKGESFDRNKILNGIIRACEKRPVSRAQMEAIVDDVERGLNNMMEKEVSTQFIGEVVMDRLKDLDEVAYVRFASVYRQFKDVSTFVAEIEKLLGTNGADKKKLKKLAEADK